MQGRKKERWEELCEMAATEKDPVKLLELTDELNNLLLEREKRTAEEYLARGKTEQEKK